MKFSNFKNELMDNFRIYLQNEFERRKNRNGQYSLRSFAQSLGLNAGCLSVILNGKRPITRKLFKKISAKLSLSPMEIRGFLGESGSEAPFQVLEEDSYHLLSQWYYDAILELVQVEGFSPDLNWIANQLGINISEVKIAIERLQRCRLLSISPDGSWKVEQNTDIHLNNSTTKALKQLQGQILNKSLDAIEKVPIERRFHSSMTMAINKEDLEEAKEYLREFRQQFCQKFQTNKKLTSVYQLSMGFIPTSKN